MTTSNSPEHQLRAQADKIAAMLKAVERGENIQVNDPSGKIAASLERGIVKFGVVMDDKVITVEMPWSTIREIDEAAIADWIITHMRGDTKQ